MPSRNDTSERATAGKPSQAKRSLSSIAAACPPERETRRRQRRRLYVVYGGSSSGPCQSLLVFSSDAGKSWSKPSAVNQAGDAASLHVAVNRNGIVGLFWRDRLAECWHFSASRDGGRTFSAANEASRCSAHVPTGTGFVQPYLMAVNYVDGLPYPDILDQLGFSVRASVGSVWKNSMTVDSEGAFQPVWMTNGESGGQIWTASIVVDGREPARAAAATATLEDISKSIAFDFENQRYDEASNTLSLDMALINKGPASIFGPLRLELSRVNSAAQTMEVLHADNGLTGAGAAWDLSELVDPNGLAPGATTVRRRRLEFRLQGYRAPARDRATRRRGQDAWEDASRRVAAVTLSSRHLSRR